MIIGIFLRNIKTFGGINYIPLSNGCTFSALIGVNGAGKSSVLEAIDCLFNEKDWNYHISTKRSGFSTTEPHIVPIFLIKKTSITFTDKEFLEKISNTVRTANLKEVIQTAKQEYVGFKKTIEEISTNKNIDDYYILPIGYKFNKEPHISIFHTDTILQKIFGVDGWNDSSKRKVSALIEYIKNEHEFLYIPKEIEADDFTKLESKEIHALMGETLIDALNKQISQQQISNINKQLNDLTGKISKELVEYEYRTSGARQQNIRRSDINDLIIDAYFKIRRLHKRFHGEWLDIKFLSSGEKQTAIIDIATKLITQHRKSRKEIIIAIDEPENSLHISRCFDQFEKVFNLSRNCLQVMIATHWYGFIPSTESGYVVGLNKDKDKIIDRINITSYREEVKTQKKLSTGKLPFDLKLKSTNDFVQSIVSNLVSDNPYNWLICEGSSERVYFDYYFSNEKATKKLKIIPVGGATEIKKYTTYLLQHTMSSRKTSKEAYFY